LNHYTKISIARRFSGGIEGATKLKPSVGKFASIWVLNPMVLGKGLFCGHFPPSLVIDHSADQVQSLGMCMLR